MDKEPSSVLLDARDATISKTVSPPRHRQRAPSSAKGCEPPILLGLAFWCAVHHPWAYLRRYRRFQGFAASTGETLVDVPADHPTGAGGATAKVTVFAALGGKAPRQPAQHGTATRPPRPTTAKPHQNSLQIGDGSTRALRTRPRHAIGNSRVAPVAAAPAQRTPPGFASTSKILRTTKLLQRLRKQTT